MTTLQDEYNSHKKTGGPAFSGMKTVNKPFRHEEIACNYIDVPYAGNLTMRDYFAAKAMQGMLSNWWTGFLACFFNYSHLAVDAYKMADAMLKAREQ
jgi:hypothetical protein